MSLETELKGVFRNDYHRGLINLLYTASRIMDEIHTIIKANDLTPQQYNILRVLRRYRDTDVNLSFIRERMIDRNSNVSRIVDNLYHKKLAVRDENKSDRRRKSISITEKGLRVLAGMDAIKTMEDKLLGNLDPSEIKELNRLLEKSRSGI